jgi:hypothetical protein
LLNLTVERRKQGESVEDAVRHFLNVMRVGAKKVGTNFALPTVQEAKRAYYRDRKKPKVRS